MQPNNKIRPFSTNTDNKYSDSDVGTFPVISTGAVNGARADSKLYNSLSANTSLVACALADLIASQNQSITFGQETPIDTWLQAVKDTFATTLVVNSIINGTTTVKNATNATNATNAIKKTDGTFTGLQLDENGVLKVGDIIIPQHKTIFKPTNPLPFEFNNNKYSATILNLGLKEGNVVKIVVNTNTNISSVKNIYYGIIGGTQIQSGTSLSNYFGKTSYLSLYNNETENSLNIIFYLLASQEESIDEYSPSTVYSGAGAIVKSGGKYYASKQDVPPNTTPGQTSGWEAYWVQTATIPTANYLYPMSTSSIGSIVSITKIIE